MSEFEEFFFFRPRVQTIPFPHTEYNQPYEVSSAGMIPAVESVIETLNKRIRLAYAHNSIIMALVKNGVPIRNRTVGRLRPYEESYIYETQESYVSFSVGYSDLTIYVNFHENDSLETKDKVIEDVLRSAHELFGCTWQRRTEAGFSEFKASQFKQNGEDIDLRVYTSDTLGCFMEVVEEEKEVEEWERNSLRITEDGVVAKTSNEYRIKDGKVVKVNRKKKMHCSGEADA